MKVYFAVNGIGLGHAGRCVAVARELRSRGVDVVFSTYGKAVRFVFWEGFRTYESPPIMWEETPTGALDYRRTMLKAPLTFMKVADHFRREYRYMKKESPDVIVSDTRYSTIPASRNIGARRLYITNQPRVYLPRDGERTSPAWLEGLARKVNYTLLSGQDAIILPDFPMPNSISRRHMEFDDAPERFREKATFVGPITLNHPDNISQEKMEAVEKKYGITEDGFIYIPISGPGRAKGSIKAQLLEILPDFPYPSLMSSGEPGEFRIRKRGNLTLVDGWIHEREVLMDLAGTVVCRAGLSTLSEVVVYGKTAVCLLYTSPSPRD